MEKRNRSGRTKQGPAAEEEVGDEASEKASGRSLSAAARLYVYALHGCLCEVAFTAVWDWCATRDSRLVGHSSVWALPMYAGAIYVMESLRAQLLARRCWLPLRLLAYTLFIYLWELSWGSGLRLLGACPWDYSGFSYNLCGLVTLEYAVPWCVAALIAEQHVIRNTLRMRLHDCVDNAKHILASKSYFQKSQTG